MYSAVMALAAGTLAGALVFSKLEGIEVIYKAQQRKLDQTVIPWDTEVIRKRKRRAIAHARKSR